MDEVDRHSDFDRGTGLSRFSSSSRLITTVWEMADHRNQTSIRTELADYLFYNIRRFTEIITAPIPGSSRFSVLIPLSKRFYSFLKKSNLVKWSAIKRLRAVMLEPVHLESSARGVGLVRSQDDALPETCCHSSTTTKVQGCRIAGLLIVRTSFLSNETSRIVPVRASEIRVWPSGSRTKPLGQLSF